MTWALSATLILEKDLTTDNADATDGENTRNDLVCRLTSVISVLSVILVVVLDFGCG